MKRHFLKALTAVLLLMAATQTSFGKEAKRDSVFCGTYDIVAPEKILDTILDQYKGKTVLIDVWATWCGPCRRGHAEMAPLKKELKGENICFVYLTPPSSPMEKWKSMIADIPGDHYYLTEDQYKYILKNYDSQGIPTYAIYNAKGKETFKSVGFPGVDEMKKELTKALKDKKKK